MSYEELFNLKSNPFRLTPAVKSEEIVWAGFPEVKEKFEKRIIRSIKIPNSSLVLNWGEYGSGKTHAARYFGKRTVLQDLAERANGEIPFFLFVTLPKGKSPIEDFYISIIDKLDIRDLRSKFNSRAGDLNPYIDSIGDNNHIKSILKTVFLGDGDINILKKYLYGNITASDARELSPSGILRALSPDSDYSKLLSGLFSCITFEKAFYSSVILWIDEFEDIATMTKVNGDKTNSFLRELLDNTPNNLMIFLNLTQSALFNIEDLGEYISEAVKSRIKERINFELPSINDLLQYVQDLISFFRVNPDNNGGNPFFPFNEDLIKIIGNELGSVSLRRFNEALGLLIELAELDSCTPIDTAYYELNKTDIIGWKE
ncbi:hypothetical protein [Rufibacter roseolus]|uniref:hypothetical protein n=1 Tax=Rufibacter roseolus TaxID=2817375 RepID=UPI001B3035D1|nr:hypothetical protein [Rufibacter roseolus]